MVGVEEATAAAGAGVVVEAEEEDGSSLLVRRSRCVKMIPKRSNLLQHYCERHFTCNFFQQYLYNRGGLQAIWSMELAT